jgi:gluconokinase
MASIILVMGVAGAGKTTVGKKLADTISAVFLDADDFHSAENKAKMASGISLTDEDRQQWLLDIRAHVDSALKNPNVHIVLACSALKEQYRHVLLDSIEGAVVIFLDAPYDAIAKRLEGRSDHFFNPALLQSQYDILEKPVHAITVDARASVDSIIATILNQLS